MSLPPNSKFKQQTEISSWVVSTSAIQKQVYHLLLGCRDLWRTERADTEAWDAWSNTSLSFGRLGEVRTSWVWFAQKKAFSNTVRPTGTSSSKNIPGKVCLPLPSTFTVSMDWRIRVSWVRESSAMVADVAVTRGFWILTRYPCYIKTIRRNSSNPTESAHRVVIVQI